MENNNINNILTTVEDVDLTKYGLTPQTSEFYETLTNQINQMDTLDKSTLINYILTNLFVGSENKQFHPVAIFNLVKILQEIANKAHTYKMRLAKIKIEGSRCNLCNNTIPPMLVEHILNGVNSRCPHNEIEVNFDIAEEKK